MLAQEHRPVREAAREELERAGLERQRTGLVRALKSVAVDPVVEEGGRGEVDDLGARDDVRAEATVY